MSSRSSMEWTLTRVPRRLGHHLEGTRCLVWTNIYWFRLSSASVNIECFPEYNKVKLVLLDDRLNESKNIGLGL